MFSIYEHDEYEYSIIPNTPLTKAADFEKSQN